MASHIETVQALRNAHGECRNLKGERIRVFNYGTLVMENDTDEWLIVPVKHCDHKLQQVVLKNGKLIVQDCDFDGEIKHHEDLYESISQYNRTPGRIGCFITVLPID